jgi:hypothetical protein
LSYTSIPFRSISNIVANYPQKLPNCHFVIYCLGYLLINSDSKTDKLFLTRKGSVIRGFKFCFDISSFFTTLILFISYSHSRSLHIISIHLQIVLISAYKSFITYKKNYQSAFIYPFDQKPVPISHENICFILRLLF